MCGIIPPVQYVLWKYIHVSSSDSIYENMPCL